jgi:hypothetical protein
MNSIFFDYQCCDDERRTRLYDGQIFVFSPCPSSLALCDLANRLTREAFGTLEPRLAQHSLPVQEYAAILAKLKPTFTHHPESKKLIQGILRELGCDLEKTYFDVPKLRTSTSDGYLTTGIAYAWHPHRDTWYSAPQCQLNWWVPIYEIDSNDGFAFHPHYWTNPVKNNSGNFNYYEWNRSRLTAAQHIKEDTRPLSRPTEPVDMEVQIRPICLPGGIIVFSAAQLHSSVPNDSGKTRFSFDFRTVNINDLRTGTGAPNIDSSCTGTALRDFRSASALEPLPDEIITSYDDETAAAEGSLLMYQPPDPRGSS